ncbi:MAG: phosphoglucosamine mutase, partial [Clostridia bacterium]
FGSASYTAPKAFESIGALVIKINNEYNGAYINKNCGATVTECMLTEQKHYKTDLAFSFDGDADRLAVYENGEIIEPNYVFYVIAKYMQEIGELKGKAVGTILTNEGLELSLNKIGIELFRSEVGDANVFRLMVKKGTVFGGEDSGHYMLTKYTLTSDAILNALFITKIHNEKGSIKDYGKELTLFPSCNLSIPWFDEDNERIERIKKAVKLKYPTIRTIIRKSGTEPKLRILAESSSTDLSSICSSIADLCEEIK